MQINLQIRKGKLESWIFIFLLIIGFGLIIKYNIKKYNDFRASYSGTVIKQGGFLPREYYLIIRNDNGDLEKRYCRYYGYLICQVGDRIIKKAGPEYYPVPEKFSNIKENIDKLINEIDDPKLIERLKKLKKHFKNF